MKFRSLRCAFIQPVPSFMGRYRRIDPDDISQRRMRWNESREAAPCLLIQGDDALILLQRKLDEMRILAHGVAAASVIVQRFDALPQYDLFRKITGMESLSGHH